MDGYEKANNLNLPKVDPLMVYENKSLEELRFEDYQLGRRGTRDGHGTRLYRFAPVRCSESAYRNRDDVETMHNLQSITAMREYKHASFEELRLEDYREGRGPKFNPLTERSASVFGKVSQPYSKRQSETHDSNHKNNVNITVPSVNFLGAPSQQRQVINAKRQLQHFKTIKTSHNTSSTIRLPFKFKSAVLNKSLDTVMSNVAQISNFDTNNDLLKVNTNCNVSEGRKCNDKEKDHSGYENNDDTEMIVGKETITQARQNNSTTGVENVDCSSSGEAQNTVNKDVSKDNTMFERETGVSHNSETVVTYSQGTFSPNKVKRHEQILNCSKNYPKKEDCKVYGNTLSMINKTNHDSDFKFKNNNKDVKGTYTDISKLITNGRTTNDMIDTESDFVNKIDIIDEPKCDNNLQLANTANIMGNQESIITNITSNLSIISNNTEIENHLDQENFNKLTDCISLNEDNENEDSNLLNSEEIVKTHDKATKGSVTEDIAIDIELEQQEISQSLTDNTAQNNGIDDDAMNNKINDTKNIFRFDATPKPRVIVKPSKLQNIIAFKTPNTRTSSLKSIFSGYPFMNPNSSNRFNFDKVTDIDKKATLNAHLQLFSNKTPKPDSAMNNSGVNAATARYIRKFTPFSFNQPNTANCNDTDTLSTPAVKTASSPFIRVSFAQGPTIPHPNVFSSVRGSQTTVSKPNPISASNTSSIFSKPPTTCSIPSPTFPPLSNFKPFSFSSTIIDTSVAFNIASIKSPSLTIKPATCSSTATSNFGVDIVNYGASTSKQCTTQESMSFKVDIAPSFKDLSVSNETDSEHFSDIPVMQSERAIYSNELVKRKSPACMYIEERNTVNESDTANDNHQPSENLNDARSNISTETTSESAYLVSAIKGASVPSLSKGKSLLKKSSIGKFLIPSNTTILESNKPTPNSLLISPQKESSLGLASGSTDAPESNGVTSSANSSASFSATLVKNPFYLGSNEDPLIKKNVAAKSLDIKRQFKLANSKLARPAFDFSKAATVSVNLSFGATNPQPGCSSSGESETHKVSNSSAFNSALPSVQTVSSSFDQSANQSVPSVFHNIEILADTLSQTNALNINSPSPSARCSNVSLQIPQSSTQSAQFQNTTQISPVSTFSFYDEVNTSISQNALPHTNPTSIFNILNTESLHPLVLHREKHRYGDIIFNNGLVTNTSHHPRNLYFFSAIPVIINQIFTIKVTELFNVRNNDVAIGFTAIDPCGINVLELHEDPMVLIDRLEYWVFETFKFQMNDEMKFQLKTSGDVEFYKNYRYTTSYFVDTTITLWLFIYIKNGVRSFSLKTNERTDLSVIEAMDRPLEQINATPLLDTEVRQNNEITNENILQNNSIWNFHIPLTNSKRAVKRNVGNINGSRRTANLNVSTRAGQSRNLGAIPEVQNIHPSLNNVELDRLGVNRNAMNDQQNSDILNRNSIPFSNVTVNDSGVNQFNPPRNANHSSKAVISKLKRHERENECIICCDQGIDCVLYTCGHSCMCLECALSILRQGDSKCPICRKIICDVIKIYKS